MPQASRPPLPKRSAREWDPVFDTVKKAVVFDNGNPLVVEMVNAMSHRGLETVLVEELAWTMAEATDPDIMEPVEKSWDEMGVKSHYNTRILEILGDENGHVKGVRTDTAGVIDCDVLIVSTPKVAKIDLARQIGVKIGMAGGIVVDSSMRTSVRNVWAAGDCCEIPHGGSGVPIQGLSGSHAHAMGKVAGTNAGGGEAKYNPVYVPWGVTAGKWVIGGVSFSETLAGALGIDFVMGKGVGISRARYYPGVKPVTVKLLAEPKQLRIIGAQMVGQEGIKERADFLAMCVRKGITAEDLARMENVYCPPIGALNEPIAVAAQALLRNAAERAKQKGR